MSRSIKIGGLTVMRGNNKLGNVLNLSLPPCRTCDHSLRFRAGANWWT